MVGKIRHLALLGMLPTVAAAPLSPYCGTHPSIDIGDGFALTEYLMAGTPDFTLDYTVPPGAVQARGVEVRAQPIRLTIANIDSPRGPYIGFLNFDVRQRDGRAYEPMNITLVCGEGPILSHTAGGYWPPLRMPGPVAFASVFSQHGYATSACVEAIARSGKLRLSFGPSRAAAPDVVIEARLQLAEKLATARRFAREELERSARGDCRIMPAPPDPF
ncbi:MAG: hypothetical protein ACJ8EB_07545 [Allosphingosinicella sp.]